MFRWWTFDLGVDASCQIADKKGERNEAMGASPDPEMWTIRALQHSDMS